MRILRLRTLLRRKMWDLYYSLAPLGSISKIAHPFMISHPLTQIFRRLSE